jgi:uncharacterized membrane protein
VRCFSAAEELDGYVIKRIIFFISNLDNKKNFEYVFTKTDINYFKKIAEGNMMAYAI